MNHEHTNLLNKIGEKKFLMKFFLAINKIPIP